MINGLLNICIQSLTGAIIYEVLLVMKISTIGHKDIIRIKKPIFICCNQATKQFLPCHIKFPCILVRYVNQYYFYSSNCNFVCICNNDRCFSTEIRWFCYSHSICTMALFCLLQMVSIQYYVISPVIGYHNALLRNQNRLTRPKYHCGPVH